MTRVLVVDDHHSWRRYVTSAVREEVDCEVVGEVGDGLDAVDEACRIAPDLILLDIGLPRLNGIEAARRILCAIPHTRILFLSEHNSSDIAAAGMQAGAYGYVLKSDAASELVPAIRNTIDGRRFIGARLAPFTREPRDAHDMRQGARWHEAEFVSDEMLLQARFSQFVEGSLNAGGAAIVISTRHRDGIYDTVKASGIDIDNAIAEGRYVCVDVDETQSAFVVGDTIDEARFWNTAMPLVVSAARAGRGAHPRVAACGELAPCLWKAGKLSAAVRLEQLWDMLARTYDVNVLCGYSAEAPAEDHDGLAFQELCGGHSVVRLR